MTGILTGHCSLNKHLHTIADSQIARYAKIATILKQLRIVSADTQLTQLKITGKAFKHENLGQVVEFRFYN